MKTLLEIIDLENQPNIINQILDKMETTKPKRGRKPVADKKKPVLLYINESLIKKHGGLEKTKNKLSDYLTITTLILIALFADNIIKF